MESDKPRDWSKIKLFNMENIEKTRCNMCRGGVWVLMGEISEIKCCETDCNEIVHTPYIRCDKCAIKCKKCVYCNNRTDVYYYNPYRLSDGKI